jgi:glycosyltransferase involved in cell wall biosynthesis
VDPEQFSAGHDSTVRQEFGIPDGTVAVGIVARLWPEKNVAMALRGVAALRARGSAHLVIVGDGPCRPELERLAVDLGLARDVTFLGMRSDVPRVLTALDIVVLTSATETFPLSVLEGMAAGRVVATGVGDVSRIVVDGQTGYVVSPDDVALFAERLDELISDAVLRAAMGRKGRQRVADKYPRTLMKQSYERLFDEILREKRVNGATLSADGLRLHRDRKLEQD